MQFNCGESPQERYKRLIGWHPWFAWWPVCVGNHDCRWIEWVERRAERFSRYDGAPIFEYRAVPADE